MHSWHISSWYDIVSGGKRAVPRQKPFHLPPPRSLSLSLMNQDESNLLCYYTQNGHRFLLTTPLGPLNCLLLNIGLLDSSPSSKAVLNGLMALSCLYLGAGQQALVYKLRATSFLRVSLDPESSVVVAISNLASSMLLYVYETIHASTSTDWAVYLCGVKKILQSKMAAHGLSSESRESLMNWVYYHETLAQFGQIYWTRDSRIDSCRRKMALNLREYSEKPVVQNVPVTIGCSSSVLDSIWEIFEITYRHNVTTSDRQKLLGLESQLRSEFLTFLHSDPVEEAQSSSRTTALHCLAALIYLNRAALGYNGTEPAHQALVSEGLKILNGLQSCETPWPLFIIACEALTDPQRIHVLQTVSRSKKESGTSHLDRVQGLIEAVWNYDDLGPDLVLDYHTKLQNIVQTAPWMPPFA